MKQKEINICGQQIKVCYCAATEKGYETITGNSINIFIPTFGTDENGKTIVAEDAKALTSDYLSLAMAGIIAAYTYEDKDAPISSKDILFHTKPLERNLLVKTIIELRNEWYALPKVVEKSLAEENNGELPKN